MDVDPPSEAQPTYTILRIKRKRAEEPLDALVVDSNVRARRRKTRGGVDVFQFAATIEQAAWEDEKQKKDLQQRISTLARTQPLKSSEESNADSQIPSTTTRDTSPVAPAQPLKTDDPPRRYTVIRQPSEHIRPSRMPPTAPPKVVSHKELLKSKSDFAYYDAVPTVEANLKEDPEMDKFMPMLEEYLKISDILLPSSSGTSSRSTEDDYVLDIFYHYPAKVNEWNKVVANVGTLTGLPASFGHPDDSDSESEPEDEEDEDSNAEDYYKNDYPDEDDWEESDGSDELQENSEDDDLVANDDANSDDEWMHSAMRRR